MAARAPRDLALEASARLDGLNCRIDIDCRGRMYQVATEGEQDSQGPTGATFFLGFLTRFTE